MEPPLSCSVTQPTPVSPSLAELPLDIMPIEDCPIPTSLSAQVTPPELPLDLIPSSVAQSTPTSPCLAELPLG